MNNATQSFLGRYRLVKVLGQGAMGVVYEAVDTRLNRTVAIKTVLRSHLVDETTASEYATRFEREAQAAARLSHPHVVTVFDFGEHEDISYIVMEFIRGRELNQAFESGQVFALPEAIRIMCELLQALDYAHRQGIVHRDIKPANVMLDAGNRVKLTDFGVARVASATQDRTMPGTLVGTPSYMSPEQILGLAVGSRADIFAAGVILYQFLTGKRPFSGGGPFGVQRKIVQDDPEPPSRVNPALPQGFDLIVSRALAKQPENRYENAAAFAADLERIAASLPRAVPLLDLDLPDGDPPQRPAAAPGANAAAATAPAAATDFDPELTLISALPIASPAAPPPRDPDETTLDPEATVIQFRPAVPASQRTTTPTPTPPPPATPTPAPPVVRTMQGRDAPVRAPAALPAQAPQRPASTAPAAARPAPSPQAPVRPAGTTRAPTARPPTATPPAPAPAPAPKRSLLPAAAGAGVAVVVLAAWLLVARPWGARDAPVAEPAAGAVNNSPAPAAPPPAPAPAAVATTPAVPAAIDPPAVVMPTAPADVPAKKPVRENAPARNPPPARPAAVAPDATPGGIEPRCGDLLQRMQLGEPLTPEQTRFFQTRCTR